MLLVMSSPSHPAIDRLSIAMRVVRITIEMGSWYRRMLEPPLFHGGASVADDHPGFGLPDARAGAPLDGRRDEGVSAERDSGVVLLRTEIEYSIVTILSTGHRYGDGAQGLGIGARLCHLGLRKPAVRLGRGEVVVHQATIDSVAS
jgi:hypothetical protein